jgi:D-amino-acid dehydrogenase
VAIVGAGAVGLCAAYEFSRAGMDVVLLDRARTGMAASANNAGWIVPIMAAPVTSPGILLRAVTWLPQRTSPLGVAMIPEREHIRFLLSLVRNCDRRRFERAAEALGVFAASAPVDFARYEQDGVQFERHESGIIMMFQNGRHRSQWESHLTPGARGMYRLVSRDEATGLQPLVEGATGEFVLCEGQARIDPRSFVRAMAGECRKRGVDIRENVEVTAFERVGARVRAVRGGEVCIEPDVVVLCAGAWTTALCKRLGARLPIRPGKGYGFDVAPIPGMSDVGLYLSEARVNLSPLAGRLRVSGVMEFGALDTAVDKVRAEAILRAPKGYLRRWPGPGDGERAWVGLRPMTPDGLPCIGWLKGCDNVLVAAGHALFGVTLAPATAKALVACVATGEAPAEISAFHPGRFGSARAA